MTRVSYQHIPNIVLGNPKKSAKKKTKTVKGARMSPQSTPYSSPVPFSPKSPDGSKPVRPKLTLKF